MAEPRAGKAAMSALRRRAGAVKADAKPPLRAPAVVLSTLTWLSLLAACESSEVDGRDLHGVFNSARPSATSAASAPSASAAVAKAKPSASAAASSSAAAIAPLERPAAKGSCLEPTGSPTDADSRYGRRPACRGATVLEHQDENGLPRYACLFAPKGASERAPLPLLVFFHDDGDAPTAVHKKTHLRKHYRKFDLSGDPMHAGFIILAPQARRMGGMLRFDTGYRAEDNADVVATNLFVAELDKQGLADKQRSYTIGHGKGGEMALMYAMARADRIAATATFASAASKIRWSCEPPVPPLAMLYRACDTVTPCADVEQWLSARERDNMPTMTLRLDAGHRRAPSCTVHKRSCGKNTGKVNHARWPRRREKEILEYLARYSLR